MGHATRSEFKAQMDLGTLVLYINPPLIYAQLLGRIKESKRHLCLRRLTSGSLGGFRNPLMRSQKVCCSYKVSSLTEPHYGWLDTTLLSLASINSPSQIIFSLFHSPLSEFSLYRAFICALIHQSRAPFFPKAQSKFPTSSFYFNFFLRVSSFNFRSEERRVGKECA